MCRVPVVLVALEEVGAIESSSSGKAVAVAVAVGGGGGGGGGGPTPAVHQEAGGWKWAPLSSMLGLGIATVAEGSSSSSTLRAARDVNSIECYPKTAGIMSKSINGGQGSKFYLLDAKMQRSSIPSKGDTLASVGTRCMYCKTY